MMHLLFEVSYLHVSFPMMFCVVGVRRFPHCASLLVYDVVALTVVFVFPGPWW